MGGTNRTGTRTRSTRKREEIRQLDAPRARMITDKGNARTPNRVRFSNRSFIVRTLSPDVVNATTEKIAINPADPDLFNWTSNVAELYEYYQITRMRFRFVSSSSAFAVGGLWMAFDTDPYDEIEDEQLDPSQIIHVQPSKYVPYNPSGATAEDCSIEVPREVLKEKGMLYTSVFHPLAVSRFTDVGTLLLRFEEVADLNSISGYIICQFDVDFFVPQPADKLSPTASTELSIGHTSIPRTLSTSSSVPNSTLGGGGLNDTQRVEFANNIGYYRGIEAIDTTNANVGVINPNGAPVLTPPLPSLINNGKTVIPQGGMVNVLTPMTREDDRIISYTGGASTLSQLSTQELEAMEMVRNVRDGLTLEKTTVPAVRPGPTAHRSYIDMVPDGIAQPGLGPVPSTSNVVKIDKPGVYRVAVDLYYGNYMSPRGGATLTDESVDFVNANNVLAFSAPAVSNANGDVYDETLETNTAFPLRKTADHPTPFTLVNNASYAWTVTQTSDANKQPINWLPNRDSWPKCAAYDEGASTWTDVAGNGIVSVKHYLTAIVSKPTQMLIEAPGALGQFWDDTTGSAGVEAIRAINLLMLGAKVEIERVANNLQTAVQAQAVKAVATVATAYLLQAVTNFRSYLPKASAPFHPAYRDYPLTASVNMMPIAGPKLPPRPIGRRVDTKSQTKDTTKAAPTVTLTTAEYRELLSNSFTVVGDS